MEHAEISFSGQRTVPTREFSEFPVHDVENSIVRRFEHIAGKYPERVAVRAGSRSLTYVELNRAANRVAQSMVAKRGISPEPVGLLLGDPCHEITAILGILKAGKFYFPMDTSHPFERLFSVFENSQADLILTDATYAPLAMELAPGESRVSRIEDLNSTSSDNFQTISTTADSLAAIFYTSGTTGRPKGVIHSHRSVLHRVRVDTNAYRLTLHDRLSLLTSPSYSVSMRNVFGALLNGASVCPFDIEESGIIELARWLSREKVSIYFSVPTVFRHFVENLPEDLDFEFLRLIYIGGEPVTRRDVELFRNHFSPNCIFANALASNEAGLFRQYFIDKETNLSHNSVPVGYEVEGKEVLLLDDNGQEVHTGEVGEIVVRSAYLSPGYWRNQNLTDEVFLPDPESVRKRIYHTGDMARSLPDGCLIHVGRKDFRRKIRGIRIEIEEVEAALHLHPDVQEVAVVDSPVSELEDARLVAYVVIKPASQVLTTELREFLETHLPDYMIPSAFMFLESLPLSANGKVDRRVLPSFDQRRPALSSSLIPPCSKLEFQLKEAWEAVLNVHPIGMQDSFFDLGGQSMLAIRLVASIEKATGKRLPPATLFQAPTIELLAKILQKENRPEDSSSLVPIQPRGTRPPFFWVHGDNSNAYLPRFLGSDQPVYALEHQSQNGKAALHVTVESIAAHYLKEIYSIQAKGPYFLGGYSFGGTVAFEMANQLVRQGEKVSLLVLLDPPDPGGDGSFSQVNVNDRRRTERETSSLGLTLNRHLGQMASLKHKERITYVLLRLKSKFNGRTAGIRKKCRQLACRIYLTSGNSLPPSLRSQYVLTIYGRAMKRYRLIPYSGRTILFQTPLRSIEYARNWRKSIVGELEVFDIPGEHMEIRLEPLVHFWAEKLKSVLDRIHARNVTPQR